MSPPDAVLVLPLAVGLAVAAVCDLATFRIPNRLVLALALGFPLAALAAQAAGGGTAWTDHLAGAGAALALGVAAFSGRLVGGGDAKLLAAVGWWAGFERLPALLAAVAFAGGTLALALLALRRLTGRLAPGGALPPVLRRQAPLPYGVAIAAGTLWAIMASSAGGMIHL